MLLLNLANIKLKINTAVKHYKKAVYAVYDITVKRSKDNAFFSYPCP
ncbi:hypothetical protein HMPREF9444_02013 [Succinatimonas hippei YIT 12066]|uniref:Uncharacterized protein n=1 Tax=Succinatimonas hippei (strain DSM 22608 / JCM 16073 / KCTC 15190 / YIT 12066) TaxID=762983 RepID=E8LML9_SUCHY|nr:hypothetical protein HMPREF9444_02013 [Succinatimonas hippei YIT 12066]